jgi:hypothetical protein
LPPPLFFSPSSFYQLFCTGQKPNTDYLKVYGDVLDPKTGMASVTQYLQLTQKSTAEGQEALNHIFVVGDAADAFGALNAGHSAAGQAVNAARNIARLVVLQEGGVSESQRKNEAWLQTSLEEYAPDPHKIKVSTGIGRAIVQNDGNNKKIYDQAEDLNVVNMWRGRGLDVSDLTA